MKWLEVLNSSQYWIVTEYLWIDTIVNTISLKQFFPITNNYFLTSFITMCLHAENLNLNIKKLLTFLKIKFDYNKSLYKTTFNFVIINVSDIIFVTLNSTDFFTYVTTHLYSFMFMFMNINLLTFSGSSPMLLTFFFPGWGRRQYSLILFSSSPLVIFSVWIVSLWHSKKNSNCLVLSVFFLFGLFPFGTLIK